MARLRTPPHVIEACLNHKSGQVRGVARTYNRYAYASEVADALALWARHVDRLVNGDGGGVVVPIRGGA